LKHAKTFTTAEYSGTLRPDALLLRDGIPSPHAKFQNSKFWGPATFNGLVLHHGYKMKWHNFGPRSVQLRLPVAAGRSPWGNPGAFLCASYVKNDAKTDARHLAKFKSHMNQIASGRYVHQGRLS
jgi:hypothetical protein